MKKYLVVLMLLFVPFVVKAEEVSLTCDKVDKINLNDEIICRLSVNSDFVYNKINFKILNTEGINTIDVRSNYEKRWTLNKDNNFYSATSSEMQSDLQEFGIILLKAVKSGVQDLTIDEISLENTDNNEKKELPSKNVSLKIISSDNLLKSIIVNDKEIDNFDVNKNKYIISINDEESIKINAISNNEFAKVKGTGEFKLSSNVSKFIYPIEVLSEDNIAKIYVLEVQRSNIKDNGIDKSIESINVKNDKGNTLLINFKPNVYEYTFDVDINTKYLNITPVINKEGLSFVKNYGVQKLELKSGNNIALVKVQDEKGDILTYVINVIKPIANKSSNNYIKSLTISGYDLKFSKRVKNYTLEIDPKDTKLDIKTVLESEKARYTITGNSNLKDGSVIRIEVTAENEEKAIYKINIKEKHTNYGNTFIKILIGLGFLFLVYKFRKELIELFTPPKKNVVTSKPVSKKVSNVSKKPIVKEEVSSKSPTKSKSKSATKNVSSSSKNVKVKSQSSKKATNSKNTKSSNTSSTKKKTTNSTSTRNPRNNYTKKKTAPRKKSSKKAGTTKKK